MLNLPLLLAVSVKVEVLLSVRPISVAVTVAPGSVLPAMVTFSVVTSRSGWVVSVSLHAPSGASRISRKVRPFSTRSAACSSAFFSERPVTWISMVMV